MAEIKAQPANTEVQKLAAEDTMVEIMGRTGDSSQYHDILAALDGFDKAKPLPEDPQEAQKIRLAVDKLNEAFGTMSDVVLEVWQGAATVREKAAKQGIKPSPRKSFWP